MKTTLARFVICICVTLLLVVTMGCGERSAKTQGMTVIPEVQAAEKQPLTLARQLKPAIAITSPADGATINSRTIAVRGKVTDIPAGAKLQIIVTPIDGRDWIQDYPPTVRKDLTFESIAYCGEGDLGIGEPFKIRVVGPGSVSSPTITVKRAQ